MSGAGVTVIDLPPGPGFFGQVAHILLEHHGDALADVDLVLPSVAHAPAVRMALSTAAGGAVFMPRVLTPGTLAARWTGDVAVDPHSRRLLRLVGQLRQQSWFGDADPWAAARELIELADTLADVPAPPDDAALRGAFERTHALHDSAALTLEARIVHAVWLADCAGTPGQARAGAQALLRAAGRARRPLVYLHDDIGTEPPWLAAYAQRAPVLLIRLRRAAGGAPIERALDAAWPVCADAELPLWSRAVAPDDARALRARVRLVSAQSLEQEAQYAAASIAAWIVAGHRRIALVASDREAARRTRALLERRQVLLADETGWKLSTTRAAATVDAFLQCIASDGYHRDLLDLVRSPYVAGTLDADAHAQAIAVIDDWVVRRNHVDGLHALLDDASRQLAGRPAGALVDALVRAATLMPTQTAPAAFWVERLLAALDALQARAALENDAAGAQVVGLLEQLRADCAGVPLALSFADWRQWLNGEFEQALFRDTAIDSPVVLTHLAATRLRSFDAVYVIGADAGHLAPPRLRGVLGHEGLRRELGLPDSADAARQLREDLAGLIACSGDVVFSWQAQRNGEANLPGADLQLLDLLFARCGMPGSVTAAPAQPEPPPMRMPGTDRAPVLDAGRVPGRLTASALADLMACPYRYYARRVLGLGEGDAVEETLGKGSVGEIIHSVLHDFHTAHPRLADDAPDALAADMRARIAGAFRDAIARNFQEHAWADRLHARADAYVAWALAREAAGWLFEAGEQSRARPLGLPDGATLSLEGRIDRIDRSAGGQALLDYKLRNAKNVKDSVEGGDDLQLAFYTLLEGGDVAEAAYLALDEDTPVQFDQPDPHAAAAALQTLLGDVFAAMRAGAPLPAHGDEQACSRCEMSGLCRKDWRT
jgi:ATP-dependent helicase/nuclease subunit B